MNTTNVDTNLQEYRVRIDEGPEQSIKVRTGKYYLAAAAALALLEFDEGQSYSKDGVIVEIWCPSLLPDYGPYYYKYDGHMLKPVIKIS